MWLIQGLELHLGRSGSLELAVSYGGRWTSGMWTLQYLKRILYVCWPGGEICWRCWSVETRWPSPPLSPLRIFFFVTWFKQSSSPGKGCHFFSVLSFQSLTAHLRLSDCTTSSSLWPVLSWLHISHWRLSFLLARGGPGYPNLPVAGNVYLITKG